MVITRLFDALYQKKKGCNIDKLETLRVISSDNAPVVMETGVVKDPDRIQN